MRRKFLFIFMLIPIIGSSQFIIDYNANTNVMNVTYTGCDICALGNVFSVGICNCRYDCENNPSEDILETYYDCLDDCERFAPPEYQACVNECTDDYEDAIEACQDACGPAQEPVRNVVAYAYFLIADWAPIPLDPRNDLINAATSPPDTVFSSTINIPGWSPPPPWPGIEATNNTCYGINITIIYDDGTACGGEIWECYFKG